MDYYELLKKEKDFLSGSSSLEPVEDDFVLDKSQTLKKDDLTKYEFLNPIRQYMIERKGVDYQTLPDEEVVDDFVQHMRYFNANSVSTAGEVRFISKADEQRKAKARKAYQIYEQLGNVFQNDGALGAVDGVKDYIFAAAKDPTNYLGLATGGVARLGVAGVSLTGKQMVRAAVRNAGKEALKSGATRQAAKAAAEKAGKDAAARAIAKGATQKQANKLYSKVADKVSKEGRRTIAQEAMRKKQKELFETAATKSLKQTIALDAGAAVLQDVMAQNVMLEAGAQESYSALQTGFSSLLGGVAGAAQLGFGKFRGASGFEDTGETIEAVANNVIDEYSPVFDQVETKEITSSIKETVKSWNKKVEDGIDNSRVNMPSELIRDILLGSDGKSGLAKIFKDKGFKLDRNKSVSDVITNVARFIPEEDLAEINKDMIKYTGLQLGELSENGIQLGDFLAKDISQAGQTLNVASQLRKTLDGGIVSASSKIAQTFEEAASQKAIEKELKRQAKAEPFKYGQSVWKRLLVSSPATTAINVAGFTQFYVGQTMADLFNSTFLVTKALGQAAIDPAASRESMRQARALTMIQAQKMRNLFDPYTTHDAYLKLLDNNETARRSLFETMAGGVEATADRYNINPDNKLYKNVEAFATAASQITGVRVQDSFTKSQMFMTELDKYLRIEKGKTLKEALLDGDEINDEVLQAALDGTLKSVFAKDYTTTEQPELLRTAAKFAETFSNTPMLGTILPFGRFFNNVVATAYQWSPVSAPAMLGKFMINAVKKEPDITDRDAFARMMVGSTALLLAMDYDNERQEKGLGVYEVDVGGGTIIDAKNTFPFSLWLSAGRILNNIRNGNPNPPELQQELGTQLVVGQLARDAQFANDINNLLDVLTNVDEGARAATIDGFYKVGGNFVSGFTRPLDAINKTVGFAMGTDNAKDVRQADGMNVFTQSATKYVDNILEAFIDKTDSITGEELAVATREGAVYDANPFARIFGVTIKPGRTATEKAYSMAEMFPWQANERTKIPAYDKALNALVAPVLEQHTQALISSPEFINASLTGKRKMLKTVLQDVKKYMRDEMASGYTGGENERLRMAARASRAATKEIRTEAMKLMKKRYGITGKLEDLNYQELDIFMDYVEYLEDIYEEASKV